MKQLITSGLTCLLLFFYCISSRAQDRHLILSETFNKVSLPSFVREIESKFGCHFYYDQAGLDSLSLSFTIVDAGLDAVLTQAFINTPVRFALGDDGEVILTRNIPVIDFFPPGFFLNEPPPTRVYSHEAIYDPSIIRKVKVPVQATLENKLNIIGGSSVTVGGTATLAGYLVDIKSGEPVAGAAVYIDKPRIGVMTDRFGYFSITLPKGRQVLYVRAIGMRDTRRQLLLNGDGKLSIDLQEQVTSLKEVVISAEKTANINRTQMGLDRIDIRSIRQVPTVFGESDIMQVILTLPGVKSVGEATSGFNVRGGAADQNLILFNGMTIYNPTHLFGFFSAFNPDVIQNVELYKSSIPASFGGRLSSVLDVSGKEGNSKKLTGSAGIGLLTSRFSLEGPVFNEKTTFVLGARTTYSNWLLDMLPKNNGYGNSKASFYDLNLLINHKFDEKNSLYLSAYLSHDQFNLNSDTSYVYSNRNASLRYKHIFSNKFNGVFTASDDHYDYANASQENKVNAYKLKYGIDQYSGKTDFTWYQHAKNTIAFGLSTLYYSLSPGSLGPLGSSSLVVPEVLQKEKALESAIYASDKLDISPNFSIDLGIRYAVYNYLGPHTVNTYAPGLPRESGTLTDSTKHGSGVIKTYKGPEYRFSTRYLLGENLSVKASFNTLNQFIHLLSNTTAISPTDSWKLSDPNIKPQHGEQYSLGLYQNLKSNTIEVSVETYYKRIHNYLDYKSGAQLTMNPHIETDVFTTRGKAYGVEFELKKSTGKLNGWISYTWSRTLLQQDDPLAGETINGGRYYPANYDKPNDLSLVGNYRFSHRFSISMNMVYSTGRPVTIPVGEFYYAGSERALYGDRNAYRIPDYFRSDFSMNIESNHRNNQKFHDSWTVGVYNLTARKNPYSTYFVSENGVLNGYKLSIFGTAIPFVNYNIKF